MTAPTIYEIRDDLLRLALKAEELRAQEQGNSTGAVMELFALDLGHHYERIQDEIKARERYGITT